MWNAWKKCSEEVEKEKPSVLMGRNGKVCINVFLITMAEDPLEPKKTYKCQ